MTAGGSSAPASSVFTTATELVGSDIRVRCPPVSFLPSGHSHTAQPSTLSTQLLTFTDHQYTFRTTHNNNKKREGQQAARRLTKKNRTKKSFYIFLFRVSKGQKDRRTRKRTPFFLNGRKKHKTVVVQLKINSSQAVSVRQLGMSGSWGLSLTNLITY